MLYNNRKRLSFIAAMNVFCFLKFQRDGGEKTFVGKKFKKKFPHKTHTMALIHTRVDGDQNVMRQRFSRTYTKIRELKNIFRLLQFRKTSLFQFFLRFAHLHHKTDAREMLITLYTHLNM